MGKVGGERARLIHDSVYQTIYDALNSLGWFTSSSSRSDVNFVAWELDPEESISFNTLGIGHVQTFFSELEVGSTMTEDRWPYYVDIFAEKDSLGLHLAHDVADIVRGKMPSHGPSGPAIPLMDYTLATPVRIGTLQVEDVQIDKAQVTRRAWQRHWYVCMFDVIDFYTDEND